MKKNCPKNFSVEVSVDEFLAVFRYPNKEVEGDWIFNESDYSREVNVVIRFMANRLKLKGLGGLKDATPAIRYNKGKATDDGDESVRFSYHTARPDMGIAVRFGGRGLKNYLRMRGDLTTSGLLVELDQLAKDLGWGLRFSRLDVAVDMVDCGRNVEAIRKKLTKGTWELRRRFTVNKKGKAIPGRLSVKMDSVNAISVGGEAQTLYLGSREYTHLRIYDKKAEQLGHKAPMYRDKAKNCSDWVRFEAVFRNSSNRKDADDYARQLIQTHGSDFESDVLKGIFCDRFNLFNVGTQKLVGWWDKEVNRGMVTPPSMSQKDLDEWQDLERSMAHFITGNSGLQSLLGKIAYKAEQEGNDPDKAISGFLGAVVAYHNSSEYKEASSVQAYKKRMAAVKELEEELEERKAI